MNLTDTIRRTLADRLRVYFAQDGALTGVRSVHGPLVDMALAGVGTGSRVQERGIYDGRFGFRLDRSAVSEHRAMRDALNALSMSHRDTLTAAYGNQRRWHPQTRKGLIDAMPARYRDAIGACILHPRVQRGMRDFAELGEDLDDCEDTNEALNLALVGAATKKRRAAKRRRMATGVLVWTPGESAYQRTGRKRDGPSEIDVIARATAMALDEAHYALALRLGMFREEPKPKPKAKRRAQEKPTVERVWPMDAP